MFAAQPFPLPRRPPIGFGRPLPLADIVWKLTWPKILSTIISILMIIFVVVIFALEIASLAKSTDQGYGNTASTGAGIWCGFFILAAAILILLILFMRRTRLWATIALIATIVAICFSIILLALDAAAVSYENDNFSFQFSFGTKPKILAAQLAFAIIEFLLCLAFIGIYIYVLIMAPRRFRRQQQNPYRF